MVSHYIHEDVMIEILVKLPVKSLLRFKCASKSWSSLITNPSFIAKHLTNKKENGCLFIHSIEPKDTNNFPRKYTFAVCHDKSLTVPVFEYLGLKLNAKVHVMGPCNGIFCLLTNWDSVALWNPANRESRTLPTQTFPNSIPPRMELERNAFGFRMDPFTSDYKVVFQNILEQDEPMSFKGIPELGCPHPGTNLKGEFLIQGEDGHLYLVDPITLEMKDLQTVASQAILYHESLVSVQRRDEEFDHSYITLRLKFDVFRDSYWDNQIDSDVTYSSSDDDT
ncbi:F-box/kelch-repeat protein At3g23880-like [Camellia sinensis]|uniref:F-box/kelch-repeat protein At3g23880-like n=1 Tax=Camellia sinensis TaxID=4442 RepID=UPI0010361FEC|nr:F-box/kelch-repeat protein At3g23880-like [Camellia sinensis]